jgi:uncharacterized protein (DUF885 family)
MSLFPPERGGVRRITGNSRLILVLFLAGVWLGACRSGLPQDRPVRPSDEAGSGTESPSMPLRAKLEGLSLDEFFEISWQELSLRDPEGVLAAGVADLLGLEEVGLTDISDAYIRETYQMHATVLEMLRSYDRGALSPQQQVSYDVYEWYLDDRVREQEFMYYDYPVTFYPVTAVHEYVVRFFTDLHPLASKQDAEDYVTRLGMVGVKFEQLLEGLRLREEAGIIPPRFASQWAVYGTRNMAEASANQTPFYEAFEAKVGALDGVPEDEKQALLQAAEEAIRDTVLPAFQSLGDYLEHLESVGSTKDGLWQFPRGDEYYAHLLRHYTTTDMTADEIHDLGIRELERIHAEMRVLFDELGYPEDESLPELYNRVADEGGYVAAKEVMATYEAIIREAEGRLDEVFAIRPQASVIVVESPIRGLYVRGSLDGTRPGAFHAGPGTATEAWYAMPTLAYHEAIPGHHFQIALGQEANLPGFRHVVGFSGYAEGWALYAEYLAWELGWYEDDPYGDLGRLQGEAFRAVRLVVDTGIHAKGWTFDQALDFLVENSGFEKGDSLDPEIEIARYIVMPGQATAYKVGMLKILDLRQRAMSQLGDQFDLKEFHSVILGNGSMPLEVLERVVDTYIEVKLNP